MLYFSIQCNIVYQCSIFTDSVGEQVPNNTRRRPHPAEEYNRIRRIILSEYNKAISQSGNLDRTMDKLDEWLIGYRDRSAIDSKGYVGLSRELHFYHNNRNELRLTPALDAGDHCDFVGADQRNRTVRIDVTSDVGYKIEKLDEFGPYLNDYEYIIAEMEEDDSEPVFYPLAFQCEENGCDGKIIHMFSTSLEDMLSNSDLSQHQEILSICSSNLFEHSTICKSLNYLVDTYRIVRESAEEDADVVPENEVVKRIDLHYMSEARYYAKHYKFFIGAFSERGSHLFRRNDEEYGDKIIWMANWGKKLVGNLTNEVLDLSWSLDY